MHTIKTFIILAIAGLFFGSAMATTPTKKCKCLCISGLTGPGNPASECTVDVPVSQLCAAQDGQPVIDPSSGEAVLDTVLTCTYVQGVCHRHTTQSSPMKYSSCKLANKNRPLVKKHFSADMSIANPDGTSNAAMADEDFSTIDATTIGGF